MKPADLGTVEPKTVAAAERREAGERDRNGLGDVVRVVEEDFPKALREALETKGRIMGDLAAICARITRLQTHLAVATAEAAAPESPA